MFNPNNSIVISSGSMNPSSNESIWSKGHGKDWSDPSNIESELLDPTYGSTYWYKKWEDRFLDSIKFGNHELIDQPVAFIYLVNISDDNLGRLTNCETYL